MSLFVEPAPAPEVTGAFADSIYRTHAADLGMAESAI
jgi:hypothetical protein